MRLLHRLSIPAVVMLFGLTACAPPGGEGRVEVGEHTVILDVRTPQEWDAGHLDGARLLDFNAGDVAAAVPDLDPDAKYLVYCRSGNRAGQAKALMERAGFADVTNVGSLESAASATGLPIVRQAPATCGVISTAISKLSAETPNWEGIGTRTSRRPVSVLSPCFLPGRT
ncbi:MAG: rhodanese-like domain-containing protein [Propioniciclava sp.]|uniref:rhodanese-like domain-containing protein n=1 Tax=Propioniciclava sp. TaxID=2038686 RepID=UPI0039E6C4A2